MKDKRNCNNNMNYPIYQQPMMVPPMGYPMYPNNFQGFQTGNMLQGGITSNTFEQQINNIEQQINLLDQRVTRLERNNNTNNNNYNDSNYYMV